MARRFELPGGHDDRADALRAPTRQMVPRLRLGRKRLRLGRNLNAEARQAREAARRDMVERRLREALTLQGNAKNRLEN